MSLRTFGPALVVVGILWRILATAWGSQAAPGAAVAFFAGMFLWERRGWSLSFIALLATDLWMGHRFPEATPFAFAEVDRLATFLFAIYLGHEQRGNPYWANLVGGVALVSLAMRGRDLFHPFNYWQALLAEFVFTGLVLIALAFVLRAEKRAS